MKFGSLMAAMMIVAAPALGAERIFEAAASYVWFQPSAEVTLEAGDPAEEFDLGLKSESGYGISAIVFMGSRLAAEVSATQIETSLRFDPADDDPGPRATKSKITPVTATLQYHFAKKAMFDPYIGVGAMYVMVSDPEIELDEDEQPPRPIVDQIESDDYAYLVNAGVAIELTESLGAIIDAKYVPSGIPLRTVVSPPAGTAATIDMTPLMVSVGITWRWGR